MNITPEQALVELLQTGSQRPGPEVNAILRSIWPELRAPHKSHSGAELIALFQNGGQSGGHLPDSSSLSQTRRATYMQLDLLMRMLETR